MKRIFFLVIVLLITTNTFSQIFGLSSSKLSSMSANTVEKNHFEFEPGFDYYWATSYYDENGKIQPLSTEKDSIDIYNSMVFRFTYGISKDFAAGIMIASDLSSVSFGAKYHFFTKNTFSAAIFAGGTFANKSDIVAINSGIFGKTYSVVTGLAFTNDFSDKWSVDFDVQYQCLRDSKVSYSRDFFANAELSYSLKNRNQIIGGFSYTQNTHTHRYDGHTNNLLTFNIGTSIETGKMFAFSFVFPITIYGKNYDRLHGLNFALTIFLD